MGFFEELHRSVQKKVTEQKLTCGICGCRETMHTAFIRYNNGLWMCGDCALAYFDNLKKNKTPKGKGE